jgi:hypothetical protein
MLAAMLSGLSAIALLLMTSDAGVQRRSLDGEWRKITEAGRACEVKVIRQRLPKGLAALQAEPAYRLARRTPAERRQCFYRQLGMSDIEQSLREEQFRGR